MTKKFDNYKYISLPDEVKSNYEGQFPSNFTDKVTELWEQSSEREGYRGKKITYHTYENDFTQLIKKLLENELNDYKEMPRKYSNLEGLLPTHTEEEIKREQNTLKAYRSIFKWEEEYFVARDIEVALTQETYFAKSWQDTITKEQVRDFNEGKVTFEEIVGDTDEDIVANAQSEGEFEVELYDASNSMGGVRLYSITLRDKFLPFTPELHEEEKVKK